MGRQWLVLSLALLMVVCTHTSEDWMNCEGLVRISPKISTAGPIQLDFAKLEVHLTSEKGQLKDKSQLSPEGYYALPVYDVGTFKLKIHGPAGWSFDPMEVKILSGVKGQQTCTAGDINFDFLGFRLTGVVEGMSGAVCPSPPLGLSGLTVTLTTAEGDQRLATTDQSGRYSFDLLLPGTYTVRTQHTKAIPVTDVTPFAANRQTTYQAPWEFGSERVVQVVNDDVELQPWQLVGGNLLGLAASGEEVVENMEVTLYSGDKPLAMAKTDANGVYHFIRVPCGKYSLVPQFRGLPITPARLEVEVGATDLFVTEPFRFSGFSVEGQVTAPDGAPIPHAAVVMRHDRSGAEFPVTSDADGKYTVNEVLTGAYTLSASLDHHTFSTQVVVDVSPSSGSLPAIVASGFSLCGRLVLDAAFSPKRRVTVTSLGAGVQETTTNEQGHFCVTAPVGQHTITPVVQPAERRQGLIFHPAEHIVELKNSPVMGVVFSQALVRVAGKVSCLDKVCPSNLVVQFSAVGGAATAKQTASAAGDFAFTNVLPGKYTASIVHENFCWERSEATVEVGEVDTVLPTFVQNGFRLKYVIPQDELTVHVKADGEELHLTQTLRKSQGSLCFPKAGTYSMSPLSCFEFDRESYEFNTQAPAVVEFYIRGFTLRGSIRVPHPDGEARAEAADVLVRVRISPKAPVKGSSSPLSRTTEEGVQMLKATLERRLPTADEYSYSFFVSPNEEVTVAPRAATFVFQPQSQTLTAPVDRCPEPISPFTAHGGFHLMGTVSPALAGVRVTTEEDEADVAAETNDEGVYRLGPFYEDRVYRVRLQKKGYQFSPKEGSATDFVAERLSAIVVRAVDAETRRPIGGVFLSLSGQGYRNNTATQADGEQEFINVPAGTFFLRAVLKEYEFEPKTQTIPLQQGQLAEVEVVGQRVAFSCFGVVTALNGKPEAGVGVEAHGADGEVEEAVTNDQGQFRIRGLKSQQSYAVRIQTGVQRTESLFKVPQIERFSPEQIVITVGHSDVTDLLFIVFRAKPTFDVSGTVDCDARWVNQLEVQLVDPSSGSVVHSTPLSATGYFEMVGVSPALHLLQYGLRVAHTLPAQYQSRGTDIKVIPIRDGFLLPRVEASLAFQAELKEVAPEVHSNPFLGLLFLALVFTGWKYRAQVAEALRPNPR
eukprot:GGOE01001573.1.p1 GENE.GGOE01001573.1~~GGOE01001573.1.p1  ORF type:complete len:1164 (+),score=331.85 GGOE01001573.1:47-3538(+)